MAAITQRLIRLRPVHGNQPHHLRLFSSSSDNGPPSELNPEPESQSQSPSQPSFSSYFRDVKASLQNEPTPQNRPPTLRKPPSPYNPSLPPPPPPQTHPPSRLAYLEEIRCNLSGFRNVSAPPPPPPVSSSGSSVSLQDLYNRHTSLNNETSPSNAEGLKPNAAPTFGSIRESLRHLRTPSPRNQNNSQSKTTDQLSLAHFSENLNADRGSSTTGGGGGGLHSIFNKEMNQNGEDGNVDSTPSMRTQLLRTYDYSELGGRLILLRPEKKKGNWFSLHELNERLANLKVIEEKERMAKAKAGNPGVMDLMKDTLKKLGNDGSQTQKKRNAPKIDILGQIGGTPNFMLSPPKDHLVEKYFHPDNMSSAEKLKLELKKVRDEFKMSESDCGSARVQVAQLSTKIKHLSTVLKKKDKHSRRGLEAMLDRRRKLLKYLRRTDWDSYCLVLSKFGIRDNNPDIKPAHKNKA